VRILEKMEKIVELTTVEDKRGGEHIGGQPEMVAMAHKPQLAVGV